jgi:hypothetical protein
MEPAHSETGDCRVEPPASILVARLSMSRLVPLSEFNQWPYHDHETKPIEHPFINGLRDVEYVTAYSKSTANWTNTPSGRPQSHRPGWLSRHEPPRSFRSRFK